MLVIPIRVFFEALINGAVTFELRVLWEVGLG
jgi:hypothetical protein